MLTPAHPPSARGSTGADFGVFHSPKGLDKRKGGLTTLTEPFVSLIVADVKGQSVAVG